MTRTISSLVTMCLTFALCGTGDAALQEFSTDRVRRPFSTEISFMSSQVTLDFLAGHAGLGEKNGFRFTNGMARTLAKGIKRVRLTQTYAGLDVFGAVAEAEMDTNENLSGQMYGEIVKDLDRYIRNPEACKRNVDKLQSLAIRLERMDPKDPNIQKKEARRIIFARPDRRPRLAYRVEFLFIGPEKISRPIYFFDACTSLVLLSYDQATNMSVPANLTRPQSEPWELPKSQRPRNVPGNNQASCPIFAVGNGGNQKIGIIRYNIFPFCLNVQRSFTSCRMEGTYSKVIDNQGSWDTNKQSVIQFLCSLGYNDAVNGAYGVANDALYYGEIAGRFFEERFNYRALSYKPRLVVHYGTNYENAGWDGTDMYFGDGESFFYPLTGLNVIAHELSHGVTTTNSDLIYRGMSGGINEAFSDITGETTEIFARGDVDWLVGADIIQSSAGRDALRFFRDPTDDGRSIRHVLGYRPSMDVHFSSGVFNRAFYLMVEQERMGIYDAYKCFLDANLNLWNPFTNFYNGACNVMQAAYDNGFNHRKVRRAFWRVGIPLIFCPFYALSTSIFDGETRKDVLVSASRSPVLKVELDRPGSNGTLVLVTSDDDSKIQVVIGTDAEADKVITTGDNIAHFPSSYRFVYVKLNSESSKDVKATINVSS